MQQYPSPDELHRRAAEGQHQLRHQHQPDKAQILVVDAEVHHALRQEGQHQLYPAAQQQPQQQLPHQLPVGFQVRVHKGEALPVHLPLVAVVLLRVKLRGRLQQQRHPRVQPVLLRAEPAAAELRPRISQLPRSRVGHPHLPSVHLVHHYKVLLVPVHNAGQGRLPQPAVVHLHADAPQPYLLRRLADAQHRHPLTGQETLFPQPLQRVAFAIVRRHHAQAGGAAVHLVVLYVVGKSFHFAIKLSNVCISSLPRKFLAMIRLFLSNRKLAGIDFTFNRLSNRLGCPLE